VNGFVPELLYAARAMQAGLLVLKPHLPKGQVKTSGTVLIGTVQGDMHDIGKNLVGLLLEGAGFVVRDVGTNVPPEAFVRAVRAEQPDVLALSALLTTTMQAMATTIAALQAAGLRDRVKIIIGGAPVTEAFAREIGADGYAPDASRAIALVEGLLTH
jgi:5-methyltetrahydrofolate--homocysteine methyltransferase